MTTDPVTLARDLMRHTLHGPPPVATTMLIAEALVKADADLAALRIEHKAHAALLDITRRDRDEARKALSEMERRVYAIMEIVDDPSDYETALIHVSIVARGQAIEDSE